jgi:hypothetical protein
MQEKTAAARSISHHWDWNRQQSAGTCGTEAIRAACRLEGSSGPANGITRRSFLKRTGAASVATLVAWNFTQLRSGATQNNDGSIENGGSGSERMCVVSPQEKSILIGHVSLAGGGNIFLYLDDERCYQDIKRCHRQKTLSSMARLRAEALIPDKGDLVPWQIYPQNGVFKRWEENFFHIVSGQIVRTSKNQLPLVVDVREVVWKNSEEINGDPVPILLFCLEISDIIRSSTGVEIQGRAWLEGEVGEREFDASECAEGYGITVVAINPQDRHQPGQCEHLL